MLPPRPFVEHLYFCPPLRSVWDPPGGRGYVATHPACGPLLILSPAVKRWVPLKQQRLCSHPAHLWASCDFVTRSQALVTPKRQGLCSHPPNLLPTSDFVPHFEVWRPPKRRVLCNHSAHLWTTSQCVPRCEALGTPKRRGLCVDLAHLCPPLSSVGDPPGAKGYVAILPTCGPPLISSPALKGGDPPHGTGYVPMLPTCGPLLISSCAPKRRGPLMR